MQTERLILRELTKDLFETIADKSIEEQLIFFGFINPEQVEKEIKKLRLRLYSEERLMKRFDLIHKISGRNIGSCGFHNWLPEHRRAEIGYHIIEEFRNQGFVSEAIKKIIQYGFETMNLMRIEAFTSPDNFISQKVLYNHGFQQEGLLHRHYISDNTIHDSVVFGLVKDGG
ncbi:MAG: GNAT family N-acetyltransferase [Bacteroidetes bacterium]|nr:GNAT family N-acetyltransferase [Bacteroidota bacterium]